MSKTIYAAGTILWRRVPVDSGGSKLMVLVVHRERHRDVSFPKGKLHRSESLPQAAVRETREEAGLKVSLGASLGTIHYELPNGNDKVVQYWAAEVTPRIAMGTNFQPGKEVASVQWVLASEVRNLLSYEADREIYDVFLRLADHDMLDSFSVTLLRHAKAAPVSMEHPEDRLRPLTPAGITQAQRLAKMLKPFKPKRIYTSDAVRCIRTVEPLAALRDKKIRARAELSQDFWDAGDLADTRKLVKKIVRAGRSVVICSHLPMLQDLARELMLATHSSPGDYVREAAALPPAGYSVFHLSRQHPEAGIIGVETYPISH